MPCPRRESNHSDGITDQKSLQRTSATKSAKSGREQVQQKSAMKASLIDHFVGASEDC